VVENLDTTTLPARREKRSGRPNPVSDGAIRHQAAPSIVTGNTPSTRAATGISAGAGSTVTHNVVSGSGSTAGGV
jgi:hypothetical protein